MLRLISIHIPKTAGTNFTQILEHLYGSERMHLDYGTERDLTAARTCVPEIVAAPERLRQSADLIHGHFHYLKYKDVFPDVPVLATLRHPVARVASQYRHIALHGDPSNDRHRRIMNGEMDIVHFSRFRFIGNAQSIFLEGIEVENLSNAIIQEHFPETVARFCTDAGFDPETTAIRSLVKKSINSRANAAWRTKAIPVEPAMLKEIEQHCRQDLELYDRAVARFVRG